MWPVRHLSPGDFNATRWTLSGKHPFYEEPVLHSSRSEHFYLAVAVFPPLISGTIEFGVPAHSAVLLIYNPLYKASWPATSRGNSTNWDSGLPAYITGNSVSTLCLGDRGTKQWSHEVLRERWKKPLSYKPWAQTNLACHQSLMAWLCLQRMNVTTHRQEGAVHTAASIALHLPWHLLTLWMGEILLMVKHSHSGGLRVRLTVLMVWQSWDKWISIGPVTLQACLKKSFPRHADQYPHSRSWHTIPSCGKLWKNIQISSPCRCFQAPTIISNTHQWWCITLRPPRTLCLGGLYLGSHNTAPVWYRTRQIRNSLATAFRICLPKASHFALGQPESLP